MDNNDLLPKFLSPFQSLTDLIEEKDAYFECQISPHNDENLISEWFQNDKPIKLGFRFDPFLEDGKVGLYISSVYETDSGTYKCRLTNKNGTAEQSATLSCKDTLNLSNDIYENVTLMVLNNDVYENVSPIAKSNGLNTTTHIQCSPISISSLEQIKLLEHPIVPNNLDDSLSLSKDDFVALRALKSKITKYENTRAVLDMEIAITNEKLQNSELIVEWFHNQTPLISSNRFKMAYEFGVVSLIIDPLNYHDRGLYQVNIYAQNLDEKLLLNSQQCQLDVLGDSKTQTDPICYESYQKIKRLEAWERPITRYAALHPDRHLPSALAILMKRRAAATNN